MSDRELFRHGSRRGLLAGARAALLVLILGDCDAQFRFDESELVGPVVVAADGAADPGIDAAVDAGADLPFDISAIVVVPPDAFVADASDCFLELCGWERENRCTPTGCDIECERGPLCSGTCGSQCRARCESATRCSLTTGDGADLECRERSSCSFLVGAGGQIRCADGAACAIRCLGACSLECEDASCRLQCASDTAARIVTGNVGCL